MAKPSGSGAGSGGAGDSDGDEPREFGETEFDPMIARTMRATTGGRGAAGELVTGDTGALDNQLLERVRVLRDEVLATADHGDRDPPGSEFFAALLRALQIGADTFANGVDLGLHDSVARRLAWGDSEQQVLADAEIVYDRVMSACERAIRDPDERMVVIEAVTSVAVTVSRVVALAAVARAAKDRAARLREEMSQKQLKEVLTKQRASLVRLELDAHEGTD